MSLPDCGACMVSGMEGPPSSVCLVLASCRKTSAFGMCARSTVMETGNVEIELGEFV